MSNISFTPKGKLSRFTSSTESESVFVHKVGTRRKYIDETGQIFVKCFNRIWKFPEQVSY